MACGSANEPVDHVSKRASVCQLRDFTGINFPSASLYQAFPFPLALFCADAFSVRVFG